MLTAAAGTESEYELERQRNIAANQAKLQRLGLAASGSIAASALCPPKESPSVGGRKRKQVDKSAQPQQDDLRRSKRARGVQPDYTGEVRAVWDAGGKANGNLMSL